MAARRAEPFLLALVTLRDRLREGAYAPGARIAATDVAEELGLSATPVREALSPVAGEGLLDDRRGQGFFVPALAASDVADLYRLSLAYLLIAQDPHRQHLARRPPPPQPELAPEGDPVRDIERLFAHWVGEGAGRVLTGAHRRVQLQLGPVRRAEAMVITDLVEEAGQLRALRVVESRADRLPMLRQFHARRVRIADRLAAALDRSSGGPEYSADIV